MPRPKPPEGYITAGEAARRLNVNDAMISRYVKQGRLQRYGPEERKQKYYKASEVQAIIDAERAFFEAGQKAPMSNEDAYFTPATPGDMDALYTMAVKLFPRTADGARRREWMSVEPRGYYIMKSVAGAVVAYFYILPLRPDRLLPYLHDELPSRAITRNDIEPFVPGQLAQAVVLGGIGSDPDYDAEVRTAYTAMLLRGVRHHLELLGEQGVTVPKFYAFSETHDGIAMCVKLRMKEYEPPVGRRCTFVLDTATSNAFFLKDYRRGLARWQQEHQAQH